MAWSWNIILLRESLKKYAIFDHEIMILLYIFHGLFPGLYLEMYEQGLTGHIVALSVSCIRGPWNILTTIKQHHSSTLNIIVIIAL